VEYSQFKEKLFAEAKTAGFIDWEAYYSTSNSFSVKIFNGEIDEYKNTDAGGLSFRGNFADKNGVGRMGYAYTENINPDVIPELVKNAADNASNIDEEIEKLFAGSEKYLKLSGYNPALDKVSVKEKIDMALALEKATFAQDKRVKSVDFCQLGTVETDVKIANSCGLDLSDKTNLAYAYVYARVEENGVTKTGFEIWHGNDFAKFSPEELAKDAVKRAIDNLGAASIPSKTYPVVFDNKTANSLFMAFCSVFFAEQAQKGFSLLKGKEGEQVAASIITLRDDPDGGEESFGKVAFDSEGVATKPKAIIENGVLKTLLYNLQAAEKDKVESTGNGFKPSFRAAVTTACTNYYVVPSDISHEEMLSNIQEGILITTLDGLHSGLNPISGDFSVSATGFMIEGGKRTKPVEQITVAGNFYDLMKNIETVASDLRFSMPNPMGTFGMPSFLVKELPISGL